MSTTLAQRAAALQAAGFYNGVQWNGQTIESLSIIVAISQCECPMGDEPCDSGGCNPDSGGLSCGWFQINQPAHPGTAAEASTLAGSAALAWEISNHGTSFTPWCTYCETGCGSSCSGQGCFINNLAAARTAVASLSSAPPTTTPTPTPPPATCPAGYTLNADGACVPATTGSVPLASGGSDLGAVVVVAAALAGGLWLIHQHQGHPATVKVSRFGEVKPAGSRPAAFGAVRSRELTTAAR